MRSNSNLKKGMTVYINTLERTTPRFSSCHEMETMVGKQFKVQEVQGEGIRIKNTFSDSYFLFSIEDVIITSDPKDELQIINHLHGDDILFDISRNFS